MYLSERRIPDNLWTKFNCWTMLSNFLPKKIVRKREEIKINYT